MDLVSVIRSLGGVAPRGALVTRGARARDLTDAVRRGAIVRLRQGVYGIPSLDPGVALAASVGGVLTCGEILRGRGVWVGGNDRRAHIALPRSGSVPEGVDAVIHWRRSASRSGCAQDSVADALVQYTRCAPLEFAVAAADSAVRMAAVPPGTFARLPVGVRLLVDSRAESGGESIVRLRLQRMHLAFRPQTWIDGVGRVDFLIGDRLVLEVDGFEFHGTRDAFERDRSRDRALVERGYVVIRVTMAQISEEWGRIEQSIEAVVRSGRHRRRGSPFTIQDKPGRRRRLGPSSRGSPEL